MENTDNSQVPTVSEGQGALVRREKEELARKNAEFLKTLKIDAKHFNNALKEFDSSLDAKPAKSVAGETQRLLKYFTKEELAYVLAIKQQEIHKLNSQIHAIMSRAIDKPIMQRPSNVTEGGIILPNG